MIPHVSDFDSLDFDCEEGSISVIRLNYFSMKGFEVDSTISA